MPLNPQTYSRLNSDPEFAKLSRQDQAGVISNLDPEFKGMVPSDQQALIGQMFTGARFQAGESLNRRAAGQDWPKTTNGDFTPQYRQGMLNSIGGPPEKLDYATAGFPLAAPAAAYARGESAYEPTGRLGGLVAQLGLMGLAPTGNKMTPPPRNMMPIYGEPEMASPSMGNRVLNYGVNQVNKIPFLPDIPSIQPKPVRPFRGYMDVTQPAAFGEASPIRPDPTAPLVGNRLQSPVYSGANEGNIVPPPLSELPTPTEMYLGPPIQPGQEAAVGNAPNQPFIQPKNIGKTLGDKTMNLKNVGAKKLEGLTTTPVETGVTAGQGKGPLMDKITPPKGMTADTGASILRMISDDPNLLQTILKALGGQ